MSNPTKLTLGQAAKEAGISKPSLSAAIKKGRLSAEKNESGTYQIDPAELFRVYPPKANTNGLDNSQSLPPTNPKQAGGKGVNEGVLDLLLGERDKLIEEKERTIKRLEEEKTALREDLEEQRDQAKRITLLLEHKSSGAGTWETEIKRLEERIANQEHEAQEEHRKLQRQLMQTRERLKEEKTRPFWKKLFG